MKGCDAVPTVNEAFPQAMKLLQDLETELRTSRAQSTPRSRALVAALGEVPPYSAWRGKQTLIDGNGSRGAYSGPSQVVIELRKGRSPQSLVEGSPD
jgi:hypothetical protein